MKKTALLALSIFVLAACKQTPSTGNFGETISAEGAKSVADFVAAMGDQEEMNGKITGTVHEVCQSEGCWYTLQLPSGEDMMIMTKNHSFSLPKDCAGKTAIAEGRAYWKTTSVDDLKHYAEDAEKTQEEIDAITEPKKEIRFEATGVLIQ